MVIDIWKELHKFIPSKELLRELLSPEVTNLDQTLEELSKLPKYDW
jgi:hypothetical protein